MEEELSVGEQKIRFDREATLALYCETIKAAGADRCNCIYCRNFAAQRSTIYPEEFLRLLKKLGADPFKEWEAFDCGCAPENPNSYLYGGWFLLSGKLVVGADKRTKQEPFSHWLTTSFPKGGLPNDVEVCAVEFMTEIPWVLAEVPK
jgi:hypothetical protein